MSVESRTTDEMVSKVILTMEENRISVIVAEEVADIVCKQMIAMEKGRLGPLLYHNLMEGAKQSARKKLRSTHHPVDQAKARAALICASS